jgi:hypothetical protein
MRHRATTRSLNIKSQRGRREQSHDFAPTDHSATDSMIRSHVRRLQDVARESVRIDLLRAQPLYPRLRIGSNPAETNDSSGLPDYQGSTDYEALQASRPAFCVHSFQDEDYAESALYYDQTAPEVYGMGNAEWMRYYIACVVR